MSTRQVDTPQGPARAHLHRPSGTPHGLVVLSHGAGGGPRALAALDLVTARDVLVAAGWVVALVEQPWMVAGRRVAGPPRTLDEAFVPVVAALRADEPAAGVLVTGGRSAGARVACRTAAAAGARATLLLSFPLHPPGRPDRLRADELALAPAPSLVVQGERDPFGTPGEVEAHAPEGTVVVPVPGAHSFPARSAEALAAAVGRFAGMLPA